MKPLSILRQFNLSVVVMITCAIYCTIASFFKIESDNSFGYFFGLVSFLFLGFLSVLYVINHYKFPKDKFYTKWSLLNYLSIFLLIQPTIIPVNAIVFNFVVIYALAVLNIILFVEINNVRGLYSKEFKTLGTLFKEDFVFNANLDFKFKRGLNPAIDPHVLYGIQFLAPFGSIIFAGDKFYFNGQIHSPEKLADMFNTCGVSFSNVTDDDFKLIEMYSY
jgi:hypothetical protein